MINRIPRKPSGQQAEILEALKNGGAYSYELVQMGILGYNARIKELREMGCNIACIMEDYTNKHGRKTKRGRFVLVSETPQTNPK